MLPRIKVCGIREPADLRTALDGGVDAIGVLLGQVHPSTDFISPILARDLLRLVPPFIATVLVTHEERLDEILALASSVPTSCIQLHSDLSPAELAAAREQLRPRFVIGKVTVEDSSSLQRAREIAPSVDAILLDSANRATGQVGGTGRVHDWSLSAQIRRASPCPVILAGGLRPTNVRAAIATVQPAAVDVNSGVEDDAGRKNPDLVRAFVAAAKWETP
jgi:phosphoribosylanthranilate isomerase